MTKPQKKGKRPTNRQLAAQLRRDAAKYAMPFKNDPDAEFRRMIEKDVAALRGIADLIQAGEIRHAYQRSSRLDTAARDGISRVVWNAMSGGAAFGHTEHDR
jgi:hypothetical protein